MEHHLCPVDKPSSALFDRHPHITLDKAAMHQRFIQVAGEGPGGSIAEGKRSVYAHRVEPERYHTSRRVKGCMQYCQSVDRRGKTRVDSAMKERRPIYTGGPGYLGRDAHA